jgi:hypothetical protein
MYNIINDKQEPLQSPKVSAKSMKVAASEECRGATIAGPDIMASDTNDPFVNPNKQIITMGQLSCKKMTGRTVPSTSHRRIRGKNATRRNVGIHMLLTVTHSFRRRANNRPMKSQELKRQKTNGMNKSLENLLAPSSHSF